MVIKRHEKGVNNDTKCNEEFHKRIENDEGNPFLKDNPQPTAVPYAEYIYDFHNKS